MKPYDVIVFADTAVDLIMTDDNIVPRFGQVEKTVADYTVEMGGSCCIFASQAARLGLRVGILGRVGDDAFGRIIIDRLQQSGVDTQHIMVDPGLKTGLTVHLTQDDDRAMLTCLGSLSALESADVTDDLLASARHLHYGSLFLHTGLRPAWVEIIKRARRFGATVSLDTNWDPEEQWDADLAEAAPYIDILMPNEQEACFLSHKSDLTKALAHLQTLVPMLTVKLGKDGAKVFAGGQSETCAVLPAEAGGDGIGAGDSFDAGFVAGWLRGLPLVECLDIACKCGRAVAGKVGGIEGQPFREDIDQLRSLRM